MIRDKTNQCKHRSTRRASILSGSEKKEFDVTTHTKDDQISRVQTQSAIIKKHGLDDRWEISDTEFENLQKTAAATGRSISDLIDTYSHVDSKTGMIVTEGWTCFGGRYFFSNEADALKKVQEYGFKSLNLASWANCKMGATYFKSPYREAHTEYQSKKLMTEK